MLIVDLVRSELKRRRRPEQWLEDCLAGTRLAAEDFKQDEEQALQRLEQNASTWSGRPRLRTGLWQGIMYGLSYTVRRKLETDVVLYEKRLKEFATEDTTKDEPD